MVNITKVSATKKLLANLIRDYSPLVMYNSLRVEDMVLMDIICKEFPVITLFTVDTGRLPAESHRLLQQIRRIYGNVMDIYYPNAYELQSLVKTQGTNGFFDSIANRQQCCAARIHNPIKRALAGKSAWLRGTYPESQNNHCEDLKLVSYDFQKGIPLLCPLHQWSNSEVWSYIKQYNVPYHSLYDRKYSVIGCEPCTRAAGAGDNKKTLWWWEQSVEEYEFPDLYIA